MAGYALFCTLCSKNFSSRKEWNQHLIQDFHQKQARIELGKWRDKEKKRSLVVYSSGKLVSGGNLLEGIIRWLEESGGRGSTFVGDLVLSPNGRDRIAVVQFESRKKVNRILSRVGGSSGMVDGGTVQVKQLEGMLELEWNEFLECFLGPEFSSYSFLDDPILTSQESITSVSLQFRTILQSMEIPREELDLVERIMWEMKQFLEETLPPCEIGLYRNNFLGLRNNPLSDTYLIIMFMFSDPNKGDGWITTIKKDARLSLLQHLLKSSKYIGSADNSDEETRLIHLESQTCLTFTTFPVVMVVEYQLSRLVSYYCLFDNRVKPLLNMLYYWIKVNNITLAKANPHVDANLAPRCLPDPIGLEWLLLFYLYHKEKLIPVPSQILDLPHTRIVIMYAMDVGFTFDPEFAANWLESTSTSRAPDKNYDDFVHSVLDLFWKFLVFYTNSFKVIGILATRTGQIWTKESHGHLDNDCNRCQMLKSLHEMDSEQLSNIFKMTHPFADHPDYKVSVCLKKWNEEVRPAMKQTADKLEQFIENWKSGKETGLILEDTLKVVL